MRRRRVGIASLIGVAVMLALVFAPPDPLRRLLYRDRKATGAAKAINASWSWLVSSGLLPEKWPGSPVIGPITIETRGRKSGLRRSNMVTWVEHAGERYLVSMLGEHTSWVRNARASNGEVVLRHGKRRNATLEGVPSEERAPIIRAWYQRTAQSTKVHIGLERDAPLEEFERIAERHPVFRIVERR